MRLLVLALLLLGEKDGVDVRENTSLGDGDLAEELVQLLVVADGQLDVSRDDAGPLVVLGGVSGKLEELGGQVLEHGGEVDGGASSDSPGVSALTEVPVDTADGELESCAGGPSLVGLGLASLLLSATSFTFSGHLVLL